MPALASRITRTLLLTTSLAVAGVAAQAQEASTKQLAPGFTVRAQRAQALVDQGNHAFSHGGIVGPARTGAK